MKRGFTFLLLAILLVTCVNAQLIITGDVVRGEEEFSLDNIFLKVLVKQGEVIEKSISLSSQEGGEYLVNVENLQGVSVVNKEFILNPGEEKTILLTFDSKELEAGVYAGRLEIIGRTDSKNLPIIFEVESTDLFFDVNLEIPALYSEILPGQTISVAISIFDITGFQNAGSLGKASLEVDYYVVDLDGNMISSETESLVVDKQSEFTKNINFPSTLKEGTYFLIAKVDYKSSVGVSSRVITVSKNRHSSFFMDNTLAFIIAGLFIFMVLIIFFVYILRSRDKLLLDLKKQNNYELKEQRDLLLRQQKIAIKKEPAKKISIHHEVKKKLRQLKKKHRKKLSEAVTLSKKGDVRAMQKKLKQWRAAGYNTTALELKLSHLSPSEMKKIMNDWKNK